MKKLLICLPLLSLTANAEFINDNISNETALSLQKKAKLISIQEAALLPDDSLVIVEGYIVKQIKDETYLFKDNSGEIEMEIDDKDFKDIEVTSKDKIRITAEVDVDKNSVSLEAEHLFLIK